MLLNELNIIKQKIEERIDCKELLIEKGIAINGQNISCLNPHHPDKNPSMAIYKDGAHCFSCNLHLDAFGIVEYLYNFNFKQSFDFLCDKCGFESKNSYNEDNKFNKKNANFVKIETSQVQNHNPYINQKIWDIIHHIEPTKEAIEWLNSRSISIKVAWNLGCRDIIPVIKEISTLLDTTSKEDLTHSHFLNKNGDIWKPFSKLAIGDNSYQGLLIPIYNIDNSIHSFRWRFFKNINSKNGTLKVLGQPSREIIPIGLNFANNITQKNNIYICEGEPDWLSFYTYFSNNNIKNSAVIGLCILSNNWKHEWTKVIDKYDKINICLHDTDKAISVTNTIALSLLENNIKNTDYWKKNFFRKLFSEKNDANDMLKSSILGHFISN